MTADLVAFLRARLDEDEREAQHLDGEEWAWCFNVSSGGEAKGILSVVAEEYDLFSQTTERRSHPDSPLATLPRDGADKYGDRMLHIARHDPERVLRDVAARRRIMARHSVDPTEERYIPDHCVGCGYEGDLDYPNTDNINYCPELRDLAAVYDDHPDYQAEWRP